MKRDGCLEAAVKELEEAGVAHEIVRDTRHFKIRFTSSDGRQLQVIVPRSGSDFRGPKNARSLVRRMLRSET